MSTKRREEKSDTRATLGGEYQFTDPLYGVLEYHHNSAAAANPDYYVSYANSFAMKKGGVKLFGKNYLNYLLKNNSFTSLKNPLLYIFLINFLLNAT